MTLPSQIQTAVSQQAITKVTRLFNGSIGDILAELLQNARRAGAGAVSIEMIRDGDRSMLRVRDNGTGITDPRDFVTLGQSGWDRGIADREDPAGMGAFSLAGRRVEVRSRPAQAPDGWRIVVNPDDWETSSPIAVERDEIAKGTTITFDLPEAWTNNLAGAITRAAAYYPLDVYFNGEPQPRRDWLKDAVHVEEWNGTRLGVIRAGRTAARFHHVNFHGVTVPCPLPTIGETGRGRIWSVLVDIVDAPDLQLVLPARKEMVQNAALDELQLACKRAIYRAIAQQPAHRLTFENWCEAKDLGVELPEADAYLSGWLPPTNDSGSLQVGEAVRDVPMLIMPDLDPDVANSAARALGDGKALGANIVLEEPCLAGYSWYDKIPKIADVQFMVDIGNQTYKLFEDEKPTPGEIKTGRVQDIRLRLSFEDEIRPVSYVPTDMLVIDDDAFGVLEDTIILLTEDATITVGQLTELLQNAVFNDSDDHDADSYETQEQQFRAYAKEIAMTLLLGEDQAILSRIEDLLAREAVFLGRDGRTISITLADGKATARYVDAGTAEPALT